MTAIHAFGIGRIEPFPIGLCGPADGLCAVWMVNRDHEGFYHEK
jgi:hypothetical protein